MGRHDSVGTTLLCAGLTWQSPEGEWEIYDLVTAPAKQRLTGFPGQQSLFQVLDPYGDLHELTLPQLVSTYQEHTNGRDCTNPKTLFSEELLDGVTPTEKSRAERLTMILNAYDEGEEVLGLRRPRRGAKRDQAWVELLQRLNDAGLCTWTSVKSLDAAVRTLRRANWDPAKLPGLKKPRLPEDDPLEREPQDLVEAGRAYIATLGDVPSPGVKQQQEGFVAFLRMHTTIDPSETSAASRGRILSELDRSRGFGKQLDKVEAKAKRPKGLQGRFRASMPFESLQIDAWKVDAEALDQYGETARLQMLVALDTVTRMVRAVLFVAGEIRMVHVKALLFDTVKGRPIWPVGEPPCPRLPTYVDVWPTVMEALVREDPNFQNVGVIHVDNGAGMVGRAALETATALVIHVQTARPGRGSDKPHVESFFTLCADVVKRLPGAVGAKPGDRPRRQTLYLGVEEIESFLRMWIELDYHERPHRGLQHPTFPGLNLSPRRYEQILIAAQGGIPVAQNPYQAVGLLRRVSHGGVRVVHDEGIRHRNREYDDHGTERLKEYSQPSKTLPARPLAVWEHPTDTDAVVVRAPDRRLVALPNRDLHAPERPLEDALTRELRELQGSTIRTYTNAQMKTLREAMLAAVRATAVTVQRRKKGTGKPPAEVVASSPFRNIRSRL